MNALVYRGPGTVSWDAVPDPVVDAPADVVVRVDAAGVCASDLRILAGGTGVAAGRVLGHEAVGTVVARGAAVTTLGEGDRVLVPAMTGRGSGRSDRGSGRPGWVLGNSVDGVHAGFARIPDADTSLHRLPDDVSDTDAVLLADVFPTGYELAVRDHLRPGGTVAVVGLGPVGLGVVMTAAACGAGRIVAVGRSAFRRELALCLGAADAVDAAGDVAARVMELTGGTGVDLAVEAVGTPETFDACVRMAAVGGVVANIGVHRAPVSLPLDRVWARDLTVTTGLLTTGSVPDLLRLVRAGRLRPGRLVTHTYPMHAAAEAYETARRATEHQAVKVILLPNAEPPNFEGEPWTPS
ncbi:zinc-binding dehydrogenase [Virgisporangium aurantiacum]|uniref:Alcohol dehydrogenase n=1 Tax=Virgisporangium aurantiacum TaxID=175570 RepID=A0A8J3Z597_9ACTN|nr:zinc-binding dehydrogenase [Virgisporangium aurantiacum]GIJ57784.1 alcohol dehydrogenase [Virgisporangium aurantiacum]